MNRSIAPRSLHAFPALLLLLAVGAPGCSSPSVTYEDPNRPVLVTDQFSLNDVDKAAAAAVNKMIRGGNLEGSDRPMVFLARIQNDTSEHVDTQAIADAIQEALLDSGRFRFTAGGQGQKHIQEQIDFQAAAAAPQWAMQAGRQIGAKYVMYGTLRNFTQQADGTRAKDYQFVIRTANIETGEVVAIASERIRKVTTNAAVGW